MIYFDLEAGDQLSERSGDRFSHKQEYMNMVGHNGILENTDSALQPVQRINLIADNASYRRADNSDRIRDCNISRD